MVDKDSIKKLNSLLKRGDYAKIHRMSKISISAISRFLEGRDNVVSEENGEKIIDTAARLIKERNRRNAAAAKKIDEIAKLV